MSNNNIEEILNNLGAEQVPEDIKKIAHQTSNNFTKSLKQQQPKQYILLEHIMKNKVGKLAAAAVIIFGVLTGMHYIGIPFAATITFADTLESILYAQTVEFDIIVGHEDTGLKMHDMVNGSRIRRTMEGLGQAIIIDFETSKMLTLIPENKTVVSVDLNNLGDIPENYFQRLKNLVVLLENDPNFVVEQLGRMQIDDRQAVGFIALSPEAKVTIWADPQTALPIRIEQTSPQINLICRNFEFDLPMDESLFSMDIPEGYTQQPMQVDLKAGTEEEFIEGLRIHAEFLNDGIFPEDISVEYFVKNATKVGSKISFLDISDWEKMTLSMNLSRHLMFIRFFEGQGQWYWAGTGVMLGDAQTPIFWYQPKDSATWRVIYGDLSVRDVLPENLPEPTLSERQVKILESSDQWEQMKFIGTEKDTWYITASGEAIVFSDITLTKVSRDENAIYIRLPYSFATLESVKSNDEETFFEQVTENRYELKLPVENLLEGLTAIECIWSVPLEALEIGQFGYKMKVQGLIPAEGFEITSVLEPDCGFQYTHDPSRTEMMHFRSSGLISVMNNASCGLSIEKVE